MFQKWRTRECAPIVERWRHKVKYTIPTMEEFAATVAELSFGGHVKHLRLQKWTAKLVKFEQVTIILGEELPTMWFLHLNFEFSTFTGIVYLLKGLSTKDAKR